jgi:formate hydrogenlyase subunit 6/NADH:ubiquinone oxidoreductase subunit I
MNEDVYTRLREFMDTMPGGYPATPSGVEIKLLKKLFTPEQAELTMTLGQEPEDVQSIAARTGKGEAELAEKLEELAMKGLIFRVRDGEKRLYRAYQFVVGVYEFQLNTLDREFSEMFEEYLPHLGLTMAQAKTSQMRVIPVESAVEATPAVETYNRMRDLVRQQEIISVEPCICRKEQGLLGNECDKPKEVCLGFGDFARYYIDNGMGRQISVDEALAVLDTAEEAGLVACPTNSQEIQAICCCCSCCCPILRFATIAPRPGDLVTSYYEARLDSEACIACELCLERCQMSAIEEIDDVWGIVDGRCIGCGLCVAACPVEAISLVAKSDGDSPPMSFDDTLSQIGEERGL